MVSAGDFRNGVTFEMDGNVYQIIEFQHVKPGKGAAFVRAKIRNVIAGTVVERTFNPNEKFPPRLSNARIWNTPTPTAICITSWIRRRMSFSPLGGTSSPTTSSLSRRTCSARWLPYKGKVFGGTPNFVELQVTKTDPGFKGDTATNATKPATLETGGGGPSASLH